MNRPASSCGQLVAVLAAGVLFWIMACTVSDRVGITFDEPGHIVSGYSHWRHGDFRINAENGILGTTIATMPLLSRPLKFPPLDSPAWHQPNARALGGSFLFDQGNDPWAILVSARAVNGIFGFAVVIVVWAWARGLFGGCAAWLSTALAVFSPTLLAHAGLATSDIVITFGLVTALSLFWILWHRITWGRLVLAGIGAGVALVAKMSGLLLLPMLFVLAIVRIVRGSPLPIKLGGKPRMLRSRKGIGSALLLTLFFTGAVTLGTIWAGYHFRYTASPDSSQRLGFDPSWNAILQGEAQADAASTSLIENAFTKPAPPLLLKTVSFLRQHRLLPEAYLWGVAFTLQASRTRPTFFIGEARNTGTPAFFPLAFLFKSTPAELLLFVVGSSIGLVLGRLSIRGPTSRRWLYRAAPLLILWVVYWAVALCTGLNIGHRHLLPIYPVLFVMAGATAVALRSRYRRAAGIVIVAALGSQLVDSVLSRPHYLSYFTPFVRNHAWRYFVDSSFDWGQGLPDLKRWQDTTNGDVPLFLSYFGSDSPRARGLHVTRVADWRDDTGPRDYPAHLRGGWYAISATNFQRVYLGIGGPWTAAYEQRYQEIARGLPKTAADTVRYSPQQRVDWLRNAMLFEVLQLGRLCHYLRDRPPVAVVGGSILIFRLTDAEVFVGTSARLDEVERLRAASPQYDASR
jgi:4-amino-4-deoxy-L-arabinose transferase-like glycosyltransferase